MPELRRDNGVTMDIKVNEFKYVPGKNDREYVALLEEYLKRQRILTARAISKLKRRETAETTQWVHSDTQKDDRGNAFALVECASCGYQTYAISNIVKDARFCPCCGLRIVKEEEYENRDNKNSDGNQIT